MNKEYTSSNQTFAYDDVQRLKLLLEVKPYILTKRQFFYNIFLKRILDVLGSIVAIILLLPVFLVVSVCIWAESGMPIFFRQPRVGRGGNQFNVYKFRTMFRFAPNNVSTSEFAGSDRFITKTGKFLRRTSIDELPQLFNVLKGEMSLVGPRPLIAKERDMDYLRKHNGVYHLRPGITGLAQIKGRDFMTIDQKIKYDCQYLHELSFINDFKIFLKTFLVVLGKDGVAF